VFAMPRSEVLTRGHQLGVAARLGANHETVHLLLAQRLVARGLLDPRARRGRSHLASALIGILQLVGQRGRKRLGLGHVSRRRRIRARARAGARRGGELEAMLSDDLETGKVLLRDYVNATVGFEALAQDMDKDPNSLMRMLSAKGNPRADNLLAMVSRLKQREGVSFSITQNAEFRA